MSGVCFVDCETTGLDPDRHEIWEVGLILPDGSEIDWQLPVDLSRADPIALNIGRFHERRWRTAVPGRKPPDGAGNGIAAADFATDFARLTRGLHLCGAVVSFDAERLWKLLRANSECPMWHYHIIDVEALAVGWLAGRYRDPAFPAPDDDGACFRPPWKSTDLSLAIDVDPEQFDRHTALGDARWAKAMYEAVMG